MKKRVLAALLALVMLFGALPMSVFAADNTATYAVDSENMPSTTPTLTDGSFILICKDGPHGDSGEDNQGRAAMPANGQYKVTTVEEYWDTAKQAWIYTIEVDTDAVMARFARFDSEHELLDRKVVATWQYNTTYNAWYPVSETTGYVATLHIGLKNSGSTTVDPTKVTPEFLDTASIHYVCDTCKPSSYYIDITSGMYKVMEHSETTFRIEWNDEAILKAYNDLYPGHTWDEQGNGSSSYHIDPFAMTWTWDATTQKWTRSGSPTIRAYVKSTASSGTDEPGDTVPADLAEKGVRMWCISSDDGHATKKITYKLNVLSYTGSAQKVGDEWKYTVKIDLDDALTKFNKAVGANHKTSGAYPSDGTITWTWTKGQWIHDGKYVTADDDTEYLALMRVMYDNSAAVPDHPDDLEQYKLYFKIACDDMTHDHSNLQDNVLSYLTIAYATNSTYGLWSASKTEDTYTVTINKAGLDAYMDDEESNGTMFTGHDVDTIAPTTLEWKLKNNAWVYQGEKTEYKGGKAIVVNVNAKAEVVEAPVPTEELLSKGSFSIAKVYCGYDVDDTTHKPYVMRCDAVNYIKGSFVENSAVKNADGTYTVQIRTAPYVDYFNQVYVNYKCPHKAKTETVSVTLAYTPDGGLSKWQVVTVNGEKQRADIPVYCEKAPDAPSITLTYNANAPAGKTVTNVPDPQTESLPAGSSVVTFQLSWAIPVCEGYKFLGWATDTSSTIATFPVEKLGTADWKSTTGNPNYILYAIWEKNPFHVTYRLKDENGKWVNAYEEDVPVAGCENHTLWTPAEKTGYKFTGWYQKAEDIGKKAEVTKLFDKTWVLYGDFTPVEYTITYDYRDKDIQEKKLYPANAATYTIEDTVTLNSITNKGMFGKTFLEWRCDLDKDGVAEKITEIPAGTTGDLTVYAYWNYPVIYTVNDEEGNAVEEYSETINVPEDSFGANLKPKPVEKDGYEFDGWYQDSKNFGNPNKRTETLSQAKNWKLYGVLKYVEKPVYVYVQPTYKGTPLTKNDAKAVAALERLGFTEGFNAGGKFATLGKLMTAKTDVAGMVDEIDNDKLKLYDKIDTTKVENFNEHVLENSIWWYDENSLTFVPNNTHKGYEDDGKIDAYHLNGTMSFQSVTFDTEAKDEVENMPEDGYYLVNDHITLGEPTREGYTFLGWSAAQDTPVITANPETDGETLYPAGYEWNVIGDVTFTAKWQLNTYTLCTTLKLNGSDKAYEVPGRGFSWTYRESGEKDTDINYKSFKDALAAKAREIDAANTPSQKQIDIVFSVGKIADVEQEIKKYGQEGINWQPNNKNTAYVSASVYTYYDVTFMDGDTKLGTETVKCGETANFADPTKYGYNFTGWYTAAEGGDKVELTTPVTKSMTLYAQWDKKEYNVSASLYLNGNGTGTTRSVKGLYDTDINYDGEDGLKAQLKEAALAADAANEPNPDKVDITICLNDKSGKPFDATTYGQEGYNWRNMEWTNPKDGQTRKWIVAYTWAYVSTYYDVTFMDGETELGTETVKCNETANEPTAPTKEGYKFLGWFKDGETTAFDFATPITQKTELTARWEKLYKIIYHGNGGLLVKDGKTFDQVTSAWLEPGQPTNLKDGVFTREHYTFTGWAISADGEKAYDAKQHDVIFPDTVFDADGNVHLYAAWTAVEYLISVDYRLKDDPAGGNVWVATIKGTVEDDLIVKLKNEITAAMIENQLAKKDLTETFAGYTPNFDHWFYASDKSEIPAGTMAIPTGRLSEPNLIMVYLKGTPNEYTVTFDPNGGEVEQTSKIVTFDDTYGELPTPTRTNYNFKGWYLNSTKITADTVVKTAENHTLKAAWSRNYYALTINYVDKKGKPVADSYEASVALGADFSVTSPSVKGYKLKNKDDAVIEGTMPGRNLTIEVVYIKKSTGGGSGTIDSPNKPTTKAPALTLNTDDHFAFINGYPDGSVQPEGNVTRAETAAILYRIMGDECQSYYKTNSSSYSDVARGDWYNTYVATLENAGVIVDTRTNGKFRPNDAITRAELASMIAQFAGLESASAAKFNDVGSRYWAAEEIAIAAKMGWINGYPDGSFRPDRNVTRAELMAMVNRALGRTPKSADDLLSGMKTWRDNANVNAWYYLDVQEATNDHTYTKSGTHETWKKLL